MQKVQKAFLGGQDSLLLSKHQSLRGQAGPISLVLAAKCPFKAPGAGPALLDGPAFRS